MHGRGDRAVPADQLQGLVPGPRFVEQGRYDRGDVGAGDRASGDRRGCEPDHAGGRGVGQAARAQDGPVQVPGAQIGLGGGLGRDVRRPEPRRCRAGAARRRPSRRSARTCVPRLVRRRRPSARRPPGRTESLRGAPLPGPAPAANTTASAPDSSTATSSAEAASRSQMTGSAPAVWISATWAGFLISPTGWSPRSARRRSSRSAIFPCPPAITIRMVASLLTGITGPSRDAACGPGGRS